MSVLLKLEKINAGYGDLKVLFDVDLHVNEGEAVALVGSNGAGKTTLLQTISGTVAATSGKISWYDQDITNMPAYKRANLGIGHVLQGRGILANMSILDNLIMGTYIKHSRNKRDELMPKILDMFPILKQRLKHQACTLSGGQQQMLAIARALMMDPILLILDEPSLGLAPVIVDEVFETLNKIKDEGKSILIIEQNLVKALQLATRGYVMETGQIKMEGPSKEILEDPKVRAAYLGI
jgi:branched-chain amino acid transport system ATP-binding protein